MSLNKLFDFTFVAFLSDIFSPCFNGVIVWMTNIACIALLGRHCPTDNISRKYDFTMWICWLQYVSCSCSAKIVRSKKAYKICDESNDEASVWLYMHLNSSSKCLPREFFESNEVHWDNRNWTDVFTKFLHRFLPFFLS